MGVSIVNPGLQEIEWFCAAVAGALGRITICRARGHTASSSHDGAARGMWRRRCTLLHNMQHPATHRALSPVGGACHRS